MPLADTVTMTAVKEQGIDYGRVRLWGSFTFIIAGYIAGLAVAGQGPGVVIYLSMAAAALTTAAALLLPRPDDGASASKLTVADAVALVRDRRFLLFLLAVGAIQGSHAVLYVFGVLHWRAQDLSAGFIATIWAISVIAEIGLFWAARWVTPLGAVPLILAGGVAGIVRWTAMAFDPAAWLLVPLQILHAGTFAATHLGAMHWIGANVPQATAGTAQALLSTSTAGVAMSILMLASGPLYAQYAGGAYAAMTLACVLGIVPALLLARAERRG
jgi:PPP family 3-phenylpropionic acid transporter